MLAIKGVKQINEPLLGENEEDEIKDEVLKMILYKTKKLRLCCCKNFMTIKMPKGNYKFVQTFNRVIKYSILVMFCAEVAFTIVDFTETFFVGEPEDRELSELENYSYLDTIQIVLTIIIMYLLLLYDKLTRKVVKRDDPFSNAGIYSFLIFMVILQKYLIEFIFVHGDAESSSVVVIRQTIMSIELLFIQIPFRHNFSLAYVEP